MDKVEKLYQNYEILANPETKFSEHEAEYLEILQSVKGDKKEKMLACQFIPRFFKDFPQLSEKALDAQLDLIEDDDASIRKLAIKHLPSFCKDSKQYVTKVADILAQMFQLEDSAELAIVHTSLMTILTTDIKGTLVGLLSQILSADDEVIGKRVIQFLCSKLRTLPTDLVTKEVEELLLQECKKVVQALSGEDFLSLMLLLSNLKIAKTLPVQQALVDIVIEQTEIGKNFEAKEVASLLGMVQCVRQIALPYFSTFISSAPVASHICLQILPRVAEITLLDKGENAVLEVIKLLAEISVHCVNLESIKESTESVYQLLLEHLLLPDDAAENNTEPNLQFTHIESLLYAFTQLVKNNTGFLLDAENADRFKDLKRRLQYLARATQICLKNLKNSLVVKKAGDATAEDTKLKAMALRTMTNINALVKDLFRSPPNFKTVITLSWKPAAKTSGVKREIESPTGPESKQVKRDTKAGRMLYSPPGGKYSLNMGGAPRANFYPRGRGRRFY